jgi:hypothetical protein
MIFYTKPKLKIIYDSVTLCITEKELTQSYTEKTQSYTEGNPSIAF